MTASTGTSVTEKNTKADILAAYHELVEKYEQQDTHMPDREQQAKRTKDSATVEKADQWTVETIVEKSGTLERQLREVLVDLRQKMLEEAEKLQGIREAIGIEEKRLQEVYEIKTSIHSLRALAETAEKRERELEAEMRTKRDAWAREREEYDYETAQKRKREEDAYRLKRETQERELTERQETLKAQEEELKTLRGRVAAFDAELTGAVERVRAETEKHIRGEERTAAVLLAEQVRREKDVAGVTLTSLQTKVEEQREEITALREQLKQVNREAKDIAVKVIEGASANATLQNLRRSQGAEQPRIAGVREE